MAIPKNLTDALSEFLTNPDPIIKKVIEKIEKKQNYFYLEDIGSNMAQKAMGYSDGSEMYDALRRKRNPEQAIKKFLGYSIKEDASEDEDSSSSFDSFDYLEEIRNTFNDKLWEKATANDMMESESFELLYKNIIKEKGMEKLTRDNLALALMNSPLFREKISTQMRAGGF